jgi:hypothetical protein
MFIPRSGLMTETRRGHFERAGVMRTRSKLAAIAVTAGLALAGVAGSATAAVADATNATFAITGTGLGITVPASTVALASVSTGAATASGQLGAVTVADNRGALVNSWTATVTTSAFVTGTSTPNETVTVPNIAYDSGAFTAHSGQGTFVAGTLTTPPSYTAGAGNSSTTWNPTLTFTLLSSQVAGTYTGTITQSVA